MELSRMSAQDLLKSTTQANETNKKIGINKAGEKGFLGKDAFLKLLVTELRHQDPTKPMEDREFISQMAQFSSLEQMTNINKEISSLLQNSRSSQAFSLLGKRIDAYNAQQNSRVSGTVSSIQLKNNSHILIVGNKEVAIDDVHAVYNVNKENGLVSDNTGESIPKNIDMKK